MKYFHPVKISAVLLCLTVLAPVASAQSVDRATVVASLSHFEHEPQSAAVTAWGASGERVLVDIMADANAVVFLRARAAHLLRLFPTSMPARDALRVQLASVSNPLSVRRASMTALVEGFNDVTEVGRYLHDADPFIRDGAAVSLSVSVLPAARDVLQRALATETTVAVRSSLETALRAIDAKLHPVVSNQITTRRVVSTTR